MTEMLMEMNDNYEERWWSWMVVFIHHNHLTSTVTMIVNLGSESFRPSPGDDDDWSWQSIMMMIPKMNDNDDDDDYYSSLSLIIVTEQQKVLQRSSAAASWARALWAERGCCTQIQRAIGSLRKQERARGSQREQESKPERALEHASTLFCCKTVKYHSVLSQNVKIRYFLSRNIKIRYFLSRNVRIRDMSRKNGINCAVSWLRILCCSDHRQ